jgi:hypothetical protein
MRGKIAAGIIAGLLAATALIGVVAVAYNAGQNDTKTVQVVDNGQSATRVVEYSRGWHGPGFFGLLVPVLLIVLVVALLTRRRRWAWRHGYGPWGPGGWCSGPYPPGYGGPSGPGPYGPPTTGTEPQGAAGTPAPPGPPAP